MKNLRENSIIIASCIIMATTLSCNDNGSELESVSIEHTAISLISHSNATLEWLRSQGFGGTAGVINNGLLNTERGRNAGVPPSLRGRNAEDAPGCTHETNQNSDGNYSYTIDFGEGCDYYGEVMHGKIEETGTYDETSFSSTITYINFGSEGWSISGTETYTGTWRETAPPETEMDSASFEITNSFAIDLTGRYESQRCVNNNGENYASGSVITMEYTANGAEKENNDSRTILSGNETTTLSTGESSTVQIDEPLVYNYRCKEEGAWSYGEGRKSGRYVKANGDVIAYSIHYGNGVCDNIVTITENGVSREVEVKKEWDESAIGCK